MTVLHIFKLEDLKQTQAVSILHNGEHPIGRDGILKCTDRRVSRRHAIIIITEDKVTLKSLHINPCFYKAAKGNIIVLVKKDESVSLNDGDQFALLADTYWFKVKVLLDNSISDLPIKQIEEKQCEKVCEVIETREVPTPSTSCLQNVSRLLNASLNAEETKIDTSELISNLNDIIEEDFGDTKNITDKEESNESMDFAELFNKEPSDSLGAAELAPFVNNDESVLGQTVQSGTEEDKVEIAGKTKESLDEIENALGKEESGVVETKCDEKSNSVDEAADTKGPSTSTDKPKTRRERCWYGASCYRKNPVHRTALSHPGDDDYKSDSEDDRPVCPFGASCYRTNVDHRRVYKHSAPPSVRKPAGDGQPKQLPQIKDGNDSESDESSGEVAKDSVLGNKRKVALKIDDSDSESDVGSEKEAKNSEKRKAAKKVKNLNETPEDDYDFDDPFLNDESDDDFQPTDDDGEDSTDWEDSQCVDEESQERKRLLKEAKKFTKAKKRKKT